MASGIFRGAAIFYVITLFLVPNLVPLHKTKIQWAQKRN
nr:MAG TPA: hypothetical protein [Caudoviricetes sp.]